MNLNRFHILQTFTQVPLIFTLMKFLLHTYSACYLNNYLVPRLDLGIPLSIIGISLHSHVEKVEIILKTTLDRFNILFYFISLHFTVLTYSYTVLRRFLFI